MSTNRPAARSKSAARRRAAAAAVSVGAGILGTQSAEAAIVNIDLTNVNGVNFTGVNAGVAAGGDKSWSINFGAAGQLAFYVMNNYSVNNGDYIYTGIKSSAGTSGTLTSGGVANANAICTPLLFAVGSPIGGAASTFTPNYYGNTASFSYTNFTGNLIAPNFDGYLGFLSSGTDGSGTNGVYGWIRATWDGSDFQFYSAAYESTPGVAIAAGAVAVPEPSTTALLGLGALALGAGAVRKQRAARRTQAAAAMSA